MEMDENTLRAATENLSLPHDVINLPTQGIFYKSKKSSLKVGYLTATDENYLMSNDNKENIVISLLRNKIYEHDLRPEELLEGDVESILIFLRNTSFGPEYTISLSDPITGKPFTTTIILDELNIKKPNHQPDDNGLFITKLPKSEATVKLRVLTYSELIELDKQAEQYPQNITPPKITWRLNKQIVELNGSQDREQISKFIESMPIMDSKYIRNFLRENQPSLDLTQTVQAPSGELVSFEITFGVEFFRPFF